MIEYSTIKQVQILIYNWTCKHGERPNTIFVGDKEYRKLLLEREAVNYIPIVNTGEESKLTCFGLRLELLAKDEGLMVGTVTEI